MRKSQPSLILRNLPKQVQDKVAEYDKRIEKLKKLRLEFIQRERAKLRATGLKMLRDRRKVDVILGEDKKKPRR